MEYINELKKRINLMIAIIVSCSAISMFTIIFYKPADRVDYSAIKALEEQRQAIVRQRQATERQIKQQEEANIYFNRRDSILLSNIEENRKEIKRVRNNEKIITISHYQSNDLVRAFAELEK